MARLDEPRVGAMASISRNPNVLYACCLGFLCACQGGGSVDQTGDKDASTCGNGVIDGVEECDDGIQNSDTKADACRTTCVKPNCYDGVLDKGEACRCSGFQKTTVRDYNDDSTNTTLDAYALVDALDDTIQKTFEIDSTVFSKAKGARLWVYMMPYSGWTNSTTSSWLDLSLFSIEVNSTDQFVALNHAKSLGKYAPPGDGEAGWKKPSNYHWIYFDLDWKWLQAGVNTIRIAKHYESNLSEPWNYNNIAVAVDRDSYADHSHWLYNDIYSTKINCNEFCELDCCEKNCASNPVPCCPSSCSCPGAPAEVPCCKLAECHGELMMHLELCGTGF
jgi:hypothetical protein